MEPDTTDTTVHGLQEKAYEQRVLQVVRPVERIRREVPGVR